MGLLVFVSDDDEEHVLADHVDWRGVEVISSALMHYHTRIDGTKRLQRRTTLAHRLGKALQEMSYKFVGPELLSTDDRKARDEWRASLDRAAEAREGF